MVPALQKRSVRILFTTLVLSTVLFILLYDAPAPTSPPTEHAQSSPIQHTANLTLPLSPDLPARTCGTGFCVSLTMNGTLYTIRMPQTMREDYERLTTPGGFFRIHCRSFDGLTCRVKDVTDMIPLTPSMEPSGVS